MLTQKGKIFITTFMLVLLTGAAFVAYILFAAEEYVPPPPQPPNPVPISLTEVTRQPTPALDMVEIPLSDIFDTGYLALVNRSHAIPAEPDFSRLLLAWPTIPVNTIEGTYLHSTALAAIADMLNSARQAGHSGMFLSSGFRGYALQAQLYAGGANADFALPAGHSEHHTGLAADILITGVPMNDIHNSSAGGWLADNSWRYGLILRYPQDSEHITGIQFEPWHFRYVGAPHAYYMFVNGLVLEEYIELLHTYGTLTISINSNIYYVFHQVPQSGMIKVPANMDFAVSSDNMGGFIITAR